MGLNRESITQQSVAQFVEGVSGQNHAMAGAVAALAAAQAVALGVSCLTISRNEQNLNDDGMGERLGRLQSIQSALLDWCDQDAKAIGEFVALRNAGKTLAGQRLLCQAPTEVSRMATEAAQILQNCRAVAVERVKDDLEISISLLAGAAQAAILLLDSNLRIWHDQPDLLVEFEPILAQLSIEIATLSPAKRIRKAEKSEL